MQMFESAWHLWYEAVVSWQELLSTEPRIVTAPWFGGTSIFLPDSSAFTVDRAPPTHGFYAWKVAARRAVLEGEAETPEVRTRHGYLVGSTVRTEHALTRRSKKIGSSFVTRVFLAQDVLPFTRVQLTVWGPDVVCLGAAMPVGDEDIARQAYEEQRAFTGRPILCDVHADLTRVREARERAAREYQERLRREQEAADARERARRAAEEAARLATTVEGRARLALAVTRSTLLSITRQRELQTYDVRYVVDGQRLACVVDERLRVVDSGICLRAEYDSDEWDEGTKGDTWLTLESLPSVVREAERLGRLVIYRHG